MLLTNQWVWEKTSPNAYQLIQLISASWNHMTTYLRRIHVFFWHSKIHWLTTQKKGANPTTKFHIQNTPIFFSKLAAQTALRVELILFSWFDSCFNESYMWRFCGHQRNHPKHAVKPLVKNKSWICFDLAGESSTRDQVRHQKTEHTIWFLGWSTNTLLWFRPLLATYNSRFPLQIFKKKNGAWDHWVSFWCLNRKYNHNIYIYTYDIYMYINISWVLLKGITPKKRHGGEHCTCLNVVKPSNIKRPQLSSVQNSR